MRRQLRVLVAQDRYKHTGQTILDAANFLVQANADPQSVFFNKLNVNQIGAIGHSQGAVGAINALIKSAGSIKAVIPIELPGQQFCFCAPSDVIDTSKITQGSVFFADGSLDLPVSPPKQPPSANGLQSIAAFYDAVPNSVRKLKGTLIGPTTTTSPGSRVVTLLPHSHASMASMGYLGLAVCRIGECDLAHFRPDLR